MINSVVLVGRLTRDPELKYTTSNIAVATFSLAVNRNFKDANGEREADFINCVAWGQVADYLGSYGKKGKRIELEGQLHTRSYDKDDKKVYITEVYVDDCHLTSSKNSNEEE